MYDCLCVLQNVLSKDPNVGTDLTETEYNNCEKIIYLLFQLRISVINNQLSMMVISQIVIHRALVKWSKLPNLMPNQMLLMTLSKFCYFRTYVKIPKFCEIVLFFPVVIWRDIFKWTAHFFTSRQYVHIYNSTIHTFIL